MIPLLLLAVGLALLAAAWLLLRSFGARFRVGRLLAATPRVSVAEARALAESGVTRFVRVDGRIDADEPFEDADHRPLVLRRARLQAHDRGGRTWRTLSDDRQQVAFTLNEGLDTIELDADALDAGLVVVPRESAGTVADLPEPPPDLPPTTPVRLRIEQVSSVEHATALGVPVVAGSEVRLTAGLGRPLVLTTLEPREAMRILAEGRTATPRAVAGLLVAGLALVAVGLAWLAVEAVT